MRRVLSAILAVMLLTACSSEPEQEQDTTTIEESARAVGREMAGYIKTPLDKAEDTAAREEQRREQLEKQAE